MELKVCFLGAVRRGTFICCRNVRISASSADRDRNRSTTIQTMNLTRSLIPQQHRPILDQLLVRLSLRQGQACCRPSELSSITSLKLFPSCAGAGGCLFLARTRRFEYTRRTVKFGRRTVLYPLVELGVWAC